MRTIPALFEDLRDPAPLTTMDFLEGMSALLEQTHALASVCHEASQSEAPTWADIRVALGVLEDYAASAQAFFARWQAERDPGDYVRECP